MQLFLNMRLNQFSKMSLHPDLFKTEIISEKGGRMVIKLQAGPNELFFKQNMAGSIDMDGRNRQFNVMDVRKEDGWTILECSFRHANQESAEKIQA